MKVYFSTQALKSGAITFPLVLIVSAAPFLTHPSALFSRHYDGVALSAFAMMGALILVLAGISFFNALEFFFLRKIPAVIFLPDEMYFRQVGRKSLSEIRYSAIKQFYIQETETRGSVTRLLIIEMTEGERFRISCNNLDISPIDLQKALMLRTPEISYQSERT